MARRKLSHRAAVRRVLSQLGIAAPGPGGKAQFQGSKTQARAFARLLRIKPIPERKF